MVRHLPGIIAVFAALFALAARALHLDEDSTLWLIVPCIVAGTLLLLWVLLNLRFLARVASSRSARYGVNMTAVALVVLFIAVMMNVIITTRGRQWDFTSNRRNSIAPLSESVARGLDRDVMVTLGIHSGESGPEQDLVFMFQQQMDLYRAASNRISYQMVNARDAAAVADAGLPQPFHAGDVIVTMNGRHERLEPFNFGDLEEKMTRAMIAVSRDEQTIVYVVTNRPDQIFEEGGGLSILEAALEGENHRVRPLELAKERAVPADCTVLVFADPLHRPGDIEIGALTEYLNRGGRALIAIDIDDVLQILSDPALRITPNEVDAALSPIDSPFVEYLAQFGIEVGRDVILEEGLSGISSRGLEMSLSAQFSAAGYNRAQDITENLVAPMQFYNARSISRGETPSGVDLFELVNGSPTAFAEDSLHALVRQGQANRLDGPLQTSPPIALLANVETTRAPVTYHPAERAESGGLPSAIQEIDPEALIEELIQDGVSPEAMEENLVPGGAVDTEPDVEIAPAEEEIPVAKLIVIGDADALRDEVLAPRTYGNRDFVLNSINHLAEETDLISIRPIDPINTGFVLSALQMRLFVLGLIVFPLLIAMTGVIVILRRRRLA